MNHTAKLIGLCCFLLTMVAYPRLGQAMASDGASKPIVAQRTVMETGRRYALYSTSRNSKALWGAFSPAMRALFGTLEAWAKAHAAMPEQLGKETRLVSERAEANALWLKYKRVSTFSKAPRNMVFEVTLDAKGVILGMSISEEQVAAPSRYLDYVSPQPHRLPFSGEWFVFWGGRDIGGNYHASVSSQRFAYDFLVVRGGSTHRGEGKSNDDYYCYGAPVYASAQGKVVKVVDDIKENVPGTMNTSRIEGNHVVIDHGNGEFSFYCHLKAGTVAVKAGDTVGPGTLLGLCGNSGNSSEPHLHFHVQDTPDINTGAGMPVAFHGYRADGVAVDSGEPIQGQLIAPVADTPAPR